MNKLCFKCGQEKDISGFYVHSQMKDGHLGKCIECAKKDAKERYVLKSETVRAYERKRNSMPNRIASSAKHVKEWKAKNPEKYKAHNALNNAVRDGKIKKPSACEICGKESALHGHHHDYELPLEVIWLCAECHAQIQ